MIRYAILEAPSNLGLRSFGVENSPTTLLGVGLGTTPECAMCGSGWGANL